MNALQIVRLGEALPDWEVGLTVSCKDRRVPWICRAFVTDARTSRARYTIRGAWAGDVDKAVKSLVAELLLGGVGLTPDDEKALRSFAGDLP